MGVFMGGWYQGRGILGKGELAVGVREGGATAGLGSMAMRFFTAFRMTCGGQGGRDGSPPSRGHGAGEEEGRGRDKMG